MYHQLAHLYDWPGALDFSSHILARDLAVFNELQLPPNAHIVDLACGTGTLSLALAEHGYHVTGIDMSPAMLAQAQNKQAKASPAAQKNIRWQEADMRYFLLEGPVDTVLCHYDSLNHLSNETELRATFLQIAQALKPGGLLIFDLNTLENYQTFWNGKDSYEGPNYRLKTQSCFDANLNKATVQFMVDEYNDEGTLLSSEETVHEHYFNETAVEKYLMAADFYDIHWSPFNPVPDIPSDFPLKTFWQCRRR